MTIAIGPDGLARCGWADSSDLYRRYHDEEWGVPLHGDRPLFEKLTLEGFQSGLSWITILKRRDGFRAAFDGFDPEAIAAYDDTDVARLLEDARIIRNRLKIEATIANAKALVALQDDAGAGALDELVWRFRPAARATRPASYADLPAKTPESTALSKALKAVGFRFVGPTTVYALMQSGGVVDDHLAGCWRSAA